MRRIGLLVVLVTATFATPAIANTASVSLAIEGVTCSYGGTAHIHVSWSGQSFMNESMSLERVGLTGRSTAPCM